MISIVVGVIIRYSREHLLISRLTKLTALPERAKPPSVKLPRIARAPSPSETEAIITAYESGLTLREVGALFGFDRGTISTAVQHAGLETRYHERTEVDLDQASQLHAQGLTITEVAERLGIGRTTLIRARRESR